MSERSEPIVATVLLIDDQRHPWRLATLHRRPVVYHTPTTVRLQCTPKTQETRQQHHVYCIADDAAWEKARATQASLQQQLNDLAAGLRELGSYVSRLAAWKGAKTTPNPLSATVIGAPDPDLSDAGSWFTNRLVPRIERRAIRGHTPKMLRGSSGVYETLFSQGNNFVCPADADWERIEALEQAAKAAELNWATVLVELGTYSEALADGRYRKSVVIPQLDLRGPSITPAALSTPADWPALASPLIYGHHRNASSGGVTHVWQPAPSPRSKQRHETPCHIVMTEPPRPFGSQSGALCSVCRRAAEQSATKQETPMQTTPAPAHVRPASSWGETDIDIALITRLEFTGYHWEMAKQTPDGRWHHLISSRNTALLRNDQVLLRRERLEALLTPAAALAVVPKTQDGYNLSVKIIDFFVAQLLP